MTNREKERERSRLIVYGEVAFFILPFFIILVVAHRKNDLDLILHSPDWSLGSMMVVGQALVRFVAGLIKDSGKKSWEASYLWIIALLFLVLFFLTNYILQLGEPPKPIGSLFQVCFFFISIVIYLIFGGIGQILLDKRP